MIVELADLKKALDLLAEINSVPLASIEWRGPDGVINVGPEEINKWQHVGLTNVYVAKEMLLKEQPLGAFHKTYSPGRRIFDHGGATVHPDDTGRVVFLGGAK
jgi:hypothetical protein